MFEINGFMPPNMLLTSIMESETINIQNIEARIETNEISPYRHKFKNASAKKIVAIENDIKTKTFSARKTGITISKGDEELFKQFEVFIVSDNSSCCKISSPE